MIKYNQIECPECEWNPNGEELWTCSCSHTWDTFSTQGKCPNCSTKWEDTYCPICRKTNKHSNWYPNRNSKFQYISKLLDLKIDDAVIQNWNKFYDSSERELKFQYLDFKNFRLLTPKNILYVTSKLPPNQDKIHVGNTFHSLKEKGRIDEETYNRFSSAISTDIILVSRDYKNRLSKYQHPYHEIDSILPVAINIQNNSYIVMGYTKEVCKGIYLVNEQLEYPLFLSEKINDFFEELVFENESEITDSSNQFIIEDPKYIIPQIEFDEFPENQEMNIDPQELTKFYNSELQRVFGIKSNTNYSIDEIEIEILVSEKKYKLSLSTKNSTSEVRIIDEFNTFINQQLSLKYGLDMKFAFYRINNILKCYQVDKMVEGLRNGSIVCYKNIKLPKQSYCNVVYAELNHEYLNGKPIDDWDENTKLVFLSDLSRY